MAKVEVKPLERNKWHGKKDKENFSRPKAVEALYDIESGRYATGLTKEEAEKYGNILGVDLKDAFNSAEPHPFYSTKSAWVNLPNHTLVFDTTKPMDFVKVKMLKASKFVGNSLKEVEQGLWPEATHYISDETEEIVEKATRIATKNKAIIESYKLPMEGKKAIVQMITGKFPKNQSDEYVEVEIANLIENDANRFLEVMALGSKEVMLRAKVLELIDKNILKKNGTAVYYMGEQLGFDMDATLTWFKDPLNQQMKLVIMDKLNK